MRSTDQHLMAEYRELPMIAKALEKTLKSKLGYQESKVSSTYILGTGRDRLISHADAALTRIRHVLNVMLREKNYEIDKLFIANDAKS